MWIAEDDGEAAHANLLSAEAAEVLLVQVISEGMP